MNSHLVAQNLKAILANTYALYLKTQNYHWHVTGIHFKPLHDLFETQYRELAEAIDEIAEHIRMLGETVPASFKKLDDLKTLSDAVDHTDAATMINELTEDHFSVMEQLKEALSKANATGAEVSAGLIVERMASHQKMAWFLKSSM
jgi:starvation-inducible DNA-binding protein